MYLLGTECACVDVHLCEACLGMFGWVCTACTLPIDTSRFLMNSNCGDLVNSGARVNTEVLNRLAELRENVANQH